MDERVRRAMAQWPNVPDVYGWLRLNRRGQWLLRGESITNPALVDFIGRNYGPVEGGGYAFQNGPQKVHVALDLTPWVADLSAAGLVTEHTGRSLDALEAVWLDAQGRLFLQDARGPAVLRDEALALALDCFCTPSGEPLEEAFLEAVLEGQGMDRARLRLGPSLLPLRWMGSTSPEEQFGFVADPRPAAAP